MCGKLGNLTSSIIWMVGSRSIYPGPGQHWRFCSLHAQREIFVNCQYHLHRFQQYLPFFGKALNYFFSTGPKGHNAEVLLSAARPGCCWGRAPLITICTCFLVHPGYRGAVQEITGRILSCIPLYLEFLGFSIINIQMKYSIPWIFITPVLDNNDSSD